MAFLSLAAPARAQDPAAFHEHLAFYRARVLYSIAVRLLHEQGVKLSDARGDGVEQRLPRDRADRGPRGGQVARRPVPLCEGDA